MESGEIRGRCFSRFLMRPAMLSGDRPSMSFSSTNARSAGYATIFMPWYFASCLRTYALWWAFLGSYDPLTLFRFSSSEMVDTDLLNAPAIARREYFFCFSILISFRSSLVRWIHIRCFFHAIKNTGIHLNSKEKTGVRIQMRIRA